MAGEWPSVTVGELADSISETHKFGKDQLIFLNTSDVLLGKILHRTYSAVRDWPGQAKKSIRRDDILFSEIRPANGRWAYVDVDADDYVVSTKLMVVRSRRSRVVPRFLYHFLTSLETTRWLQHLAESRSGTFPQITFDQVAALELALPPPEAQTTIAAFLDGMSDKIELNRRMNETLEAMARALFKSWFVDFDPVRAKAEGRDPGFPKPLADLFPARLVDSELGEIPVGWRASVLGEELTRCGGRIQTGPFGSQLHASDYVADGVPVVMPKDLSRRRVSTQSIARVNINDAERLSRHRLQQGDIVYSRRGDVEQHGLVHRRETGWLCGTGCLLVRPGPKWPSPLWVSIALDRPESRAWIVQHAIGATMPNLNTGILARVPLVVPPDEILWAFDRSARPLADKVISADAQTATLVSLRDALLPKLISGEIRVRDSASTVETC
jgi:type I restriction enzyme S subunit